MKLFLNGVENTKHRRLMQEVGIQAGCLSFAWAKRSKKTNWHNELLFLDELMVDHGIPLIREDVAVRYDADEYIEFVNEHKDIIDFAFDIPQLGCYVEDNCPDVTIVPFFSRDVFNWILDQPLVAIPKAQLDTPFFMNYYKQMYQKTHLHGYNISLIPNHLRLDSANTIAWLLGKYGYTFYYDGKQLGVYNKKKTSYRSIVARKMIQEGYDLNYNKILKDDSEEVNKMNLYSWKEYIDSVGNRRK